MRQLFKTGHRVVSPRRVSFAHRLSRFPVLIGMTLALALATTALILVLATQTRLTQALTRITHERIDTTGSFCRAINANSRKVNGADDYLGLLVVTGARQSKPFEQLLRAYGAPPYAKRVAVAKGQAAKITSFRISRLDCAKLRGKINAELPRR